MTGAEVIAQAARGDWATPFEITLFEPQGEQRWRCLEVLRALPDRRLVVRAQPVAGDGGAAADVGRASVVLKLFIGRQRRRYCRRERFGLEALIGAGVPAPRILAEAWADGVSALVLEFLPGARPVGDDEQSVMETIAGYFGRLHAAGVWQVDTHLENFLRVGDTVHALDGDGVRVRRRPLGLRQGLNNLASLAAQRAPCLDGGLEGLLAAYARQRGMPRPALHQFRPRLERARRQRIRRYLVKTRRNCSEFVVARRAGTRTYVVRGEGERLLTCLPTEGPDPAATRFLPGTVLKDGNSATVIRWRLPGGVRDGRDAVASDTVVVVKRYNVKNALKGLKRALSPLPRYRRAWMYGQLLNLLRIPTARPLLLIEETHGPRIAYLAQRSLGGPDLAALVADSGLDPTRVAEVAALFASLRAAGLAHGDTKATNLLLHDGRLHLIDLDAMRISRGGWRRDVERFLANWSGQERRAFEAAFREVGLL